MKKKLIPALLPLILCAAFSLTGCGAKEIYSDEQMTASLEDNDGRKDLRIYFNLPAGTPDDGLKERLTELGISPVRDYETEMSDGTGYGYHDDTNDQSGSGVYIIPCSTIDEIENVLGRNLWTHPGLHYPEEETNFVMQYSGDGQRFSVHFAAADLEEGITVRPDIQLNLSSGQDRTSNTLIDVSESIAHESWTTSGGLDADLFIDEAKGRACLALTDNACLYYWKIFGDISTEKIKAFAEELV